MKTAPLRTFLISKPLRRRSYSKAGFVRRSRIGWILFVCWYAMMLRRALLLLSLTFICFNGAQAQRLPGGVRPEHYALTITPELATARFAGTETIDVVLALPTDKITLNAAEITFGSVKARVGNSSALQTATVTLDAAKQQATFTFAQPLPAGPVTLEIAYTGRLNDKLRGFYLSHTKLRSYGVTQFESTDARRAFPSFDEPALKATFNVSLVIDVRDTAISNTKIISDAPGSTAGKHTVTFATTPKMSTYLLAWLVGDFECTAAKQDGVAIRACATPDKVRMTKFALDAAKWYLHYYDTYFGIKYPLAKLDLIAIPDFEAGAMENFGCITFRETALLIDRKNDDVDAHKQIAATVSHEMAHQWFGDLVTPTWWDNIWLNEGFATWMEAKASAVWKPEWEYTEDSALDKEHTMDQDASTSTRTIRTRAETPAEIDELFDGIAYGKAGAVIAMIEHWVGEDVFRQGLQAYLAAHAYGNATAEDLWDAETKASGLPVDKVMHSFVDQPGVPLVSLASDGAVTQRRFTLAGSSADASRKQEGWTIPICVTTEPCRLLLPASSDRIDLPPGTDANAQDRGYYRTEYAPPMLHQLERNAESRLSVPERISLIGDQWALMRAGHGGVGEFLDLVLALKQDASAKVMDLALADVDTIESNIATEDDRHRMDAILRREFTPVFAALAKPKHESPDHAELRQTLFEELGRAHDPAVLADAEAMAKKVFAGKKLADPELADAAVDLATMEGDPAMQDSLMKVAANATDPHMKAAALNSLTRFDSPALVAKTLDYAVSDAVRSQDSWTLIALLLKRRETQDQTWEYVQQHWPEIARKSTANSGGRIVAAAGAFCTVERRDQVANFFHGHAEGSSPRVLNKSLDRIDECIHLRAAQQPALRSWLNRQAAP